MWGEGHGWGQGPEAGAALVHLRKEETARRGGGCYSAGSSGALGPGTESDCPLQGHERPWEGLKQKVMGSDLWFQRLPRVD